MATRKRSTSTYLRQQPVRTRKYSTSKLSSYGGGSTTARKLSDTPKTGTTKKTTTTRQGTAKAGGQGVRRGRNLTPGTPRKRVSKTRIGTPLVMTRQGTTAKRRTATAKRTTRKK